MQKYPGQNYLEANVQPPKMGWKRSTMPCPFKIYRNCDQIKCTYESIEQAEALTDSDVERVQMGQMLADIYGLTRQSHVIKEEGPFFQAPSSQRTSTSAFHQALLRPVPSGGALFPGELYMLVGSGRAFPAGLYHYDAAHHALDILRQGDYSQLLQASLAHPGDALPSYTFFWSCFFWKDGFKYGAFSYRLQGFDIGAVIGQSLIISDHYHLEATVHYQFLDKALDELAGLNPMHESIYAVITLAPARHVPPDDLAHTPGEEAIRRQAMPTALPLESVAYWPLVEAVHSASLMETRSAFRPLHSLAPMQRAESAASLKLPPMDETLDLWQARYQRHSAAGFRPAPLCTQQLAQLLLASTCGTSNDLDGPSDLLPHTALYCIVNNVEGIPSGIYSYHPEEHRLAVVAVGEVQSKFQELLGWANFNLFQMSVCLVPVANYKQGFHVYGDRWYRMQNMEAGIIAQRLYLAAATLKLGCRANLGFPVPAMDKFLRLPEDATSLLQILIAPEHPISGHYAQSLLL